MLASRSIAVVLLAFVLSACAGDGPAGPPPEPAAVTQEIDISNVFAQSALFSLLDPALGRSTATVEIRRIRLTAYGVPGDAVLFQKVYDVDPNASSWRVAFTVPAGSTVRLVAELMSVTAGSEKVEYSGQAGPVTITPCTTGCTPIPIATHPGPVTNLGATSVAITPRTVTLEEGATQTLSATALPAGPAYEMVWSSLNNAIATVTPAGVVTAVAPGTARVVVAVGPRRDTATITVSVKAGRCVVTPYAIGATANGIWADGDCLASSNSGRRYDMYEFTIANQTAFRAQVTGPSGRRISLRRSGTEHYVQMMAGEAFMPPTANPLEVRYILAPGSYVFEIANPDAATLGSYTLATSLDATVSCNPLVFVTVGVTINEQLSPSDCDGVFGGKEDWYLLLPSSVGERIDLTLSTTQIAPVLVFRDDRLGPASPTLTSDVRFNIGDTARTAYTTTFPGFHEIVVNNATAALGSYKLTIGSGNAANTCVATPTTIGGRSLAIWEATDCTGEDGLFDRYTFSSDSQVALKTTTTSVQAPKLTGIFKDGREVLNFIRSPAGDLAVNWYLSPGSYEIRAAGSTAPAGTAYTLATAQASSSIGCATNATSGNVTFSSQTLGTGDCTFNNRFEDRLSVLVEAGKEIVLEMTAGFGHSAIIRDPGSTPGTFLVRQEALSGSTTAVYQVPVTGYYQVIFSTMAENATGSYSGSVTVR